MNNPDTEKSLFIPAGHKNGIIIAMILMMVIIVGPFLFNGTGKVHYSQPANVPNMSLP